MAAVQTNTNSPMTPEVKMQIELAWQMGCGSLAANNNQILINSGVYKLVGTVGLQQLKQRLSTQLGGVPVVVFFDKPNDIIRILEKSKLKPILYSATTEQEVHGHARDQNSPLTTSPLPRPLRAFGKKSKVPRPPNAFIIYRAQFHPHVKQHNPQMHNNEISKALGERWKNEPASVKEKYKKMELELKAKHAARYPDYQYSPRKPGEKKRRMTPRKLEKLRRSQNAQEASNSPSPDTFMSNSFEYSTDSDQVITYNEDDTYSAVLPSSFDDIQHEIFLECGVYNQDYYDIALEVDDSGERPNNHLLQAAPTSHTYAMQNSWDAIVDWNALTDAVNGADGMTADSTDLTAVQASGPDSKHVPLF